MITGKPHTIDVAIIGGGPGGLAAAHAICKAAPQLKVAIFEKVPQLSRRGAGLGIDVNGQRALQAIDAGLHKAVVAQGVVLRRAMNLKSDGTVLHDAPISVSADSEELQQQGIKVPCLLGWAELQQTLVEHLPAQAQLHLGADFSHYTEDASNGTVTVHFNTSSSDKHDNIEITGATSTSSTNNSRKQGPVSATLLVAADGYFSRVRRQCLNDGPPEYRSTVIWRARLSAAAAAAAGFELLDNSVFVSDSGRFMFMYPINSGDVVWTVGATDEALAGLGLDVQQLTARLNLRNGTAGSSSGQPQQQQQPELQLEEFSQLQRCVESALPAPAGKSLPSSNSPTSSADLPSSQGFTEQDVAKGEAARHNCLQALAGFMPEVLQLVANTPPGSLVEHGVYIRPAADMTPEAYGRDRVVVLGDAAHPLRPTGQGLNTTLEDAYQLAAALMHSGSSIDLEAVQAFRVLQAQRLKPIVKFTTESGEASYRGGRLSNRGVQPADASDMTASEFREYLYSRDFRCLGSSD